MRRAAKVFTDPLDYLAQEDPGEITLTLPFAALVSDNRRLVGRAGRRVLSREYRDTKEAVALLAMGQIRGPRPALPSGPVSLLAEMWFPDARKRDAANYRKLVTDALTGIAYGDDAQIHDERWVRAGIDRANPRIEITITAITLTERDEA